MNNKKEKPRISDNLNKLLGRLEELKLAGFPEKETLKFLADLAALTTTKTLKPPELEMLKEVLDKTSS